MNDPTCKLQKGDLSNIQQDNNTSAYLSRKLSEDKLSAYFSIYISNNLEEDPYYEIIKF